MAKLSKSTRERMAKALVRHKLQARAEELMAESVAIYDAVYAERYDAETQKLMGKLFKLHPKAFATENSDYINAGGYSINVGAVSIGYYSIATWQAEAPTRPVFRHEGDTVSEALTARVRDFGLASKAFADEIKSANARALSTLNVLGTAKRLQDEWPEALPVIGDLIPTEDRTLPVVQLDAINDDFGLPPQTEAA